MNIDELVFRASSTSGLTGVKGLGKTGYKTARHAYIESKTGRTRKIESKYLSKGINVESTGIEMLAIKFGLDLVKNEERKWDDMFTGECDIDTGDCIIDHKASWDIFTHDDAKMQEESDYIDQMHVYMRLWKRDKAKVAHVLIDASDEDVLKALEKESFNHRDRETPEYIEAGILRNMIYSQANFDRFVSIRNLGGDKLTDRIIETFIDIPFEDRFHIVDVPFSKERMNLLEIRVKEARAYLKTVYK